MQVQSEDVTVAWGQQPSHLDTQYGHWRLAVFQDVQESLDQTKLFYLYDPESDDRSRNMGQKSRPAVVVFDLNLRCFVGDMPLNVYGKPKFLFGLKAPSQSGGSSFVLVSEVESGGMFQAGEYICTMREDAPEIVVMANPGLQVWRVDALAQRPSEPTAYFTVPGAELTEFYDGLGPDARGYVYLLSSFADGNLDYSRIHVLSLNNMNQINTHTCHADPSRGMPPARKQAAIDYMHGNILLAGGEVEYGGTVSRLSDYWVLDLTTFQWSQVPSAMPVPLIEPRLTTTNSGNVYLWGDFDQPLPGMPHGTHLRILRITGFGRKAPPPSYEQSNAPQAYPALNPQSAYPSHPAAPYPQSTPAYPPSGPNQAPPYPSYQPNQAPGYGQPGGMPQYQGGAPQHYQGGPPAPSQNYQGGPPPNNAGYSGDQGGYQPPQGQQAYYPPTEKKKKSCAIQ